MEASFVKYQREWSKAMGVTDTNVKRVQQRFDGMTKSINNAGANTARALQPVAGQTSNIAAQFQDIAVQLQGGQSPFLIAMQQGTQLSAVLNQSKSPIAALSAGFMQMVNPISLATIAAIALGGAAAQYLGKLLGEGKSAEELLKEHNETIRSVAEKWGDAVPALKAYVDQLDRAKDQTSLGQAYDEVVLRQFETLRSTLSETRAEFAAARTDLAALGASAQEIDALQSEFDTLRKRAEDGSATTADLERMMELLAQTTGASTVPSLVSLQGILAGVSQALATASREAAVFREEQAKLNEPVAQVSAFNANREFIAEQERLNGLTADQLNLENEIARVRSEAERGKTLVSDQQALEIAQGRLAAEDRRSKLASAERSAGKTENRERDAVLELIAALEHEQTLLGLNAQQKAVANALRQAGAAATDTQREAIIALVNATYEEQAALDLVNDQVREFSDAGRAALSGFIQDVLAGKNATEALGNALANIGNRLINMGLDSLFSGGASGGGLLGGLLKIPGRESGGPVQAGQPYVVGERRPELFVPTQNGVILPRLPSGGGGGSASVTYAPTIDARGADEAAVAKLAQVMARDRAEFEGRVRKIVSRRSKEGW
ncbi:hypothetical protein VW29_02640 [Devosia limi DSM 17137]|nr:hypothetical protein VW29_02640 [Devosia limi DSM 17137]